MIKNYIIPTIIVLTLSILISLAIQPLENTEWADSFRTGEAEEEEDRAAELGAVSLIIGPLLKETIFMGIPALITIGVLGFINRKPKAAQAASRKIPEEGKPIL